MTDKKYSYNHNCTQNILSKCDSNIDTKSDSSSLRNVTIWNKTIKMIVFSSLIFSTFLILRHRKMLLRSYDEQKMSMFSETAFYYSFYEDIANSSEKIYNIIQKMIFDDRTEYPDVINSLSRFNIYQEVILGVVYRAFRAFDSRLRLLSRLIYFFNSSRSFLKNALGYNISNSDSIVLSTPFNFYYFSVNLLLGFGMGILCGTSTYITNGSYLSGLTCMGFLFGNFRLRLLSRISSLPLRENFALPFIWINNMILLSIVKNTYTKNLRKQWFLLYLTSVILLEFWQFSVFVISTQLISAYIIFLFGYEFKRFKSILNRLIIANITALLTSYLLHFFNYYILLTPLPQIGISILLSITLCEKLSIEAKAKHSLKYSLISGSISLILFFAFRLILSPFSDHDTHVFDMLKAVIFGRQYANFDTMIYKMGGSEFSFISKEQIGMISSSGVLFVFIPGTLLILFSNVCDVAITNFFNNLEDSENSNSTHSYQIENSSSQIGDDISESSFDSSISSTSTSHSTKSVITSNQDWSSCFEHNLQDELFEDSKKNLTSCYESQSISIKKSLAYLNHTNQDSAVSLINIQTIIFCLLAVIISRLRVLALPYIVIISSLFASGQYLQFMFNYYWGLILRILRINYNQNKTVHFIKTRKMTNFFFLVCSITIISLSMFNFPSNEIKSGYIPENNASSSKSRLIDWINSNLPEDTPILSDMVVSATLRLTTKTKIITHPQYEHIKIRKRTQFMYSISACISIKELYETMEQQYKTEYLLLNIYRCAVPKDKSAITVVDVAGLLDNVKHRCNNQESIFQRTCWRIQLDHQSRYFDLVYRNAHYSLYKRKRYQDLKLVQISILSDRAGSNNYSQFPFKRRLLDWDESWKSWIVNHCIKNDAFCPQNIVDYARAIIDIYNIIDVSKLLYEKAISIYPNNSYVMFNYAEFLDYDIGDDPKRVFEKYDRSIKLYKQENSEYNYSEITRENDGIVFKANQGFGLKMILGYILFSEQINGRSEHLIIKSLDLIIENELIKSISSNFDFMGLLDITKYLYLHRIVDINLDMCLVNLAYNICMISSYLKTIEMEGRKLEVVQKKYPSWLMRTIYNKLWVFSKALDPNNTCIVKYWSLFHNKEKDNADYIYSFFLE